MLSDYDGVMQSFDKAELVAHIDHSPRSKHGLYTGKMALNTSDLV